MRSLASKLMRFGHRRFGLVAFSTDAKHGESLSMPMNSDTRNGRHYFNEICDALWQCRRGVVQRVEPKLLIMDAPRVTMQCRAWSEFVDDGLVGVWAQQALRRDLLAYLKPEGRLASMVLDMAKVLQAASEDNSTALDDKHMFDSGDTTAKELRRLFYQLLDEMMDRVFVKRQCFFKDVSMATEALGRYVLLLKAPPDVVEGWTNIVNDWIESSRFSSILSPSSSDDNTAGSSKVGMTSLSSFLSGLAKLNIRPSNDELRLVAIAWRNLSGRESTNYEVAAKTLIDFFRAWHAWHINPEAFVEGVWSKWFKAYEIFLQKRPIKNKLAYYRLIATAFLLAKDFGELDGLLSASKTTEATLEELLRTGALGAFQAENLLASIRKLKAQHANFAFSEELIMKLRSIADSRYS